MKTTFEGKIEIKCKDNSVKVEEYSNETDYKNALEDLKKSSDYKGYSAKSSYKTVPEIVDNLKESNKNQNKSRCCDECNYKGIVNPFPGFGLGQDIVEYFDDITTGDNALQKTVNMRNELNKCKKEFAEKVDELSLVDVKAISDDIKDIIEIINGYNITNNDAIKSKTNIIDVYNKFREEYQSKLDAASKSLEEASLNLQKLNIVKDELMSFKQYYEDINDIATGYLKSEDLTKSNPNPQDNDSHKSDIRDLLEMIFGKGCMDE